MDLETAAERDVTIEIPASIFATPGERASAVHCRRAATAIGLASALHSAV